jgi:hypothetical protein
VRTEKRKKKKNNLIRITPAEEMPKEKKKNLNSNLAIRTKARTRNTAPSDAIGPSAS